MIVTLHKHRKKRDKLVKEYQVVWHNVKHWYNICVNNQKVMSVAFFEANFKQQFETLFVLAEQIKQFYDIFDAYSDAIAQAA